MFADLPCLKYDVIVSLHDFDCVSEDIEYLIIGNGCLNKAYGDILDMIDFSVFVNVRVLDVGMYSLQNVKNVDISSMILSDQIVIELIFLNLRQLLQKANPSKEQQVWLYQV